MFVHWAFFLFRLYIKWNYIVFVILDISLSIIPLRSIQFSSVQFSRSVLSEYLQTHEHQHLLLPSIFPSIRDFSKESALCIRGPKYWSFSFISPSSEHPGLTSFRMDWLDRLAVQGTLKSLLQHHSSKASILQCSAFFIVRLSHPYMTAGKITVVVE